jgi:hypothetical protein
MNFENRFYAILAAKSSNEFLDILANQREDFNGEAIRPLKKYLVNET